MGKREDNIMKQKQWIRITVIFFAFMIVLTIFSRGAASVTKAKVTVTKAAGQTISHEIRLDGLIEAKDNFLQYVPSGLMVKSVRVSPGQQVKSGDVLFTVDTQRLGEKIGDIKEQIADAEEKNDLTVSRAEKAYQDAVSDAQEEKDLAYRDYEEAVNTYNEYIDTHPVFEQTAPEGSAENGAVPDESYYNESTALELENAMEAAQSAYERVVREQDKIVQAAADSLQQTKEDLALDGDTALLEESLKELQPFLENEGQYLAEYQGVVDRILVNPGIETTAGVAVLIADSDGGVRLEAAFPEEYRDDITQSGTVTLMGENLNGEEESYVVSNAAVSKANNTETGNTDGYTLTADIPGDLFAVGSTVSVTVDNRSEEYDTCVPLQCLRQNGNYQYFIYVTEEQDTVLGNETVAKEMIVNVLDKNERYAALEETVSGDVILSANKDITDGSRVVIIE